MPLLKLVNLRDGKLRWDASSLLISTIMVPDDVHLRREYAASLRRERARGLQDGEKRLSKQDHVLAAAFERRPRIQQLMQTRLIHSILAGAMLWDLYTAATAHPALASKGKIEFAIDRLSVTEDKLGSRTPLRNAWRQFRSALHWCAALTYQSRVFGCAFPQYPDIGYIGEIVITDFLQLGESFLEFAKQHVNFPAAAPSFWTTPRVDGPNTRLPGWPDAHVVRQGLEFGPDFLQAASGYSVQRDKLNRDVLNHWAGTPVSVTSPEGNAISAA